MSSSEGTTNTDPLVFVWMNAPADVTAAVRWLLLNEFHVVGDSRRTSPFSTFGFYVDLANDRFKTRVGVDRSQWGLDLGYPSGELSHLEVLLIAQSGTEPPTTEYDTDELPEQLPAGVSWSDTLPPLLEWLQLEDRRAEIAQAQQRWEAANMRAWDRLKRTRFTN